MDWKAFLKPSWKKALATAFFLYLLTLIFLYIITEFKVYRGSPLSFPFYLIFPFVFILSAISSAFSYHDYTGFIVLAVSLVLSYVFACALAHFLVPKPSKGKKR